jgi:3-keto-L-gulonate-6-phosphate decarboxylase
MHLSSGDLVVVQRQHRQTDRQGERNPNRDQRPLMLSVLSMKIAIDVHHRANDEQRDHTNGEDEEGEESREDASRVNKVSLAGGVAKLENDV